MPERRLLDTTELFAALPEDFRAEMARHATTRQIERGDLLFAQGDESSELFVVNEGRIAIATHGPESRESVIAILETGGLFGELGLFDGGRRSADARALLDTELTAVRYATARAALQARPELLWVVVRLLSERLRATDEALSDAVFLDVPARTAKRLLELAGDADEVRLPVTQEELAAMVGASRERVNKALSLFARLGWIEANGRGRYLLVDRTALSDRASQ